MAMVNRPVNIQGTRDWMQYFRGDILRPALSDALRRHLADREPAAAQLQHPPWWPESGKAAGEQSINACEPDVVVLQEAVHPEAVERLSSLCGMKAWAALRGYSLAVHEPSRYCSLRLAPDQSSRAGVIWKWCSAVRHMRIYGVHLSADPLERHGATGAAYEMRALLKRNRQHQKGFIVHDRRLQHARARRTARRTADCPHGYVR